MTKPNIVLFCENNHYDGLTHAAEEAVLDRLNKNKWTHSLFEGKFGSEKTETELSYTDLKKSHFLQMSPESLCFSNNFLLNEKFSNYFTSYDFDVSSANRNELFNEMSLCPKLNRLHSSLTDSEFVGIMTEDGYVDHPVDMQRDKDIVQNLENLSMRIGNNYTIGWAGQSHCVDFHHYLTEYNSPLLERIKFININSFCSIDKDVFTPNDLSAMFGTYYFSECLDDTRVQEIFQRSIKFLNYSFFHDPQSPQDKVQALWEQDFIKSPHVLNVNVSISDEPGSILPWQIADLDIFN